MEQNLIRPRLGRDGWNTLEGAVRREWLVTNGLGGYACGTVGEVNTRRYHGLLMAAFAPPLGRTLLVAALDTEMRYGGERYPLATHEYGDGTVDPRGYLHLESFYWNDYVLSDQYFKLQDTNDYRLANLQKDGTYSVVPRIPGGEITPDKLIAIGEVARKYKLYPKITGGQRIDLFGARLEQLPHIWQALIEAGFESGHAYAKAVRTVKSCVGSTWCRYGVQDSVGMAIFLEHRYKGIRAPHKIKMAVSGCTRECAEAQCKDIGVIATEKGWNLYLCGNGGMKPRHADLFATDLDDETLVRYIDRFMAFYIRTADRLQRTAAWLENLEGGLDYLREVIIDDKLGICAELERQIQHLVETYECEWKKTLENEEILRKRFRFFVNAEGGDDNVVFIEERGQIRPATLEEKRRFKGIPIELEEAS